MQVGFGKHDMPWHNKTSRKTDGKGNKPCRYTYSYIDIAKNMKILFTKQYIVGKVVNKNVEDGIGTATGKVSEGLCRYNTSERLMEKIYYSYYYMSGFRKQVLQS